MLLISTKISAQEYKKITEVSDISKFSTNLNLGYSSVNGNKDNVINFDIYANYLFAENFGAFVGLGKYLGRNNSSITDTSGTIGSQMAAGLTFAITGSLQNKKTTEYYTKTRTETKNNNVYVMNNRVTRKSLNDIDGFRASIFVSNNEYTKVNNAQYGSGAKLFYEMRLKESLFLNYGIKYDYINTSLVEGSFFQGYVGVVIIP